MAEKFKLKIKRKMPGNKQGMARMNQDAYVALLEVCVKNGTDIKDTLSQMVLWCAKDYDVEYIGEPVKVEKEEGEKDEED